MHPSFDEFVASLRDPAQRAGIGLVIGDDDAAALLTNANWAHDYYTRWIALFPIETPAPAAPASPFGPPPIGAPTQPVVSAFPAATIDAPLWAESRRPRWPAPARIALIAVLTIVALSVIAGVVKEVVAVTRAPVAAIAATGGATPPPSEGNAPDQSDPVVFHGLTQTEYDLIEAILASHGRTLEQAVAGGTSDAMLQQLAVSTQSSTAKSCTDAAALDNGFDNDTFHAAFIAAYESAQKATPAQSEAVYHALAAYCAVH